MRSALCLCTAFVFVGLGCSPSAVKKTKNTADSLNKAATSCPDKMALYPVERIDNPSNAPHKDFPIFLGLGLAPKTEAFKALAEKTSPNSSTYQPLPEALQAPFAAIMKSPVWVYGPDGKACKLTADDLYYYNDSNEMASRLIAHLSGDCPAFNDKKAPMVTVAAVTPVLPQTCQLKAALVSVDPKKDKQLYPKPLAGAMDFAACAMPSCKHYYKVDALSSKAGPQVRVIKSTMLKLDNAKIKAIERDTSKTDEQRKQSLEQLYCDFDRKDVFGNVWRPDPKSPWQRISTKAYAPDFYGWIEDSTGVRTLLMLQHGEFEQYTLKSDKTLSKTSALKWMVPHPENIGEDFSLGPYCGP